MLFVFKKIDEVITFDKVVFWNAPNSLVDGKIKQMYEDCATMVRNGEAFYYNKKGRILDKFPKDTRSSNGICHVRPHARVKADEFWLPIPDKTTGIISYTKQSFWFNKDFVDKILKGQV
jgi:hypothetical protein